MSVRGDRIAVDGTTRFLVFLSYFDGVRRAQAGDPAPDLAFVAPFVDGIRVLPNWWASTCPLRSGADTLIDLDGAIRPGSWAALERLLDASVAHGLIVDVSFTRETVTDNAVPARALAPGLYERALVELVGSDAYLKGRYPNVLVDVQNEWERFADAQTIERLLARVHQADPSRVLTASVSGERYRVAGRDIPTMLAAYHDPRGPEWFSRAVVSGAVAAIRQQVSQPIYLQEPMPWGTVCDGQVHDESPEHHRTALEAARGAGAAAWTFHTRLTFDLAGESLAEKVRRAEHAGLSRALGMLRDVSGAGSKPGSSGS